jgi:CBS domain-containing protein
MTIARVLERRGGGIVSCQASATVEEAARLLAGRRIGALPVLEGEGLAGIFSERDLLYSIAAEGQLVLGRRVHEVMTSPPITVEPRTPVLEALALMTKRRIRHLPVIDGGALAGFVSIGDLVKYRIDAIEEEAQQMRAYIQRA